MRPIVLNVVNNTPDAPTGLTVAAAGTGQVKISWTDPTPVNYVTGAGFGDIKGEIGFRVEKATGIDPGATFIEAGKTLANSTSFTDSVVAGEVYQYRVVAYNANGDSGVSDTVYIGAEVVSNPSWIWAPATSTSTTNTIGWGASTTAGVTYELVEAQNAGFSVGVRTVYSGPALTASVIVAALGDYYYRVRATKTGAAPSQWKISGPMAVTPQRPAWIWAPATTTKAANNIGWGASTTQDVSYELVEAQDVGFTIGVRGVYSGPATVATVSINASGAYFYRVRTTKTGCTPSPWVVAGPMTATLTVSKPAWVWAPATTTAATNTIGWGASSTAGVTYELEEAQDAAFTVNLRPVYSGTLLINTVTISESGSYYYRVRATKTGNTPSIWVTTGVMTASLLAQKPAWIWTPSTTAATTFTAGWGASPTAGVTYVTEEAKDAAFTVGLRTVYSGASLTTSVTVAAPGTYYYRVRATKTSFTPSAWTVGSVTTVTVP